MVIVMDIIVVVLGIRVFIRSFSRCVSTRSFTELRGVQTKPLLPAASLPHRIDCRIVDPRGGHRAGHCIADAARRRLPVISPGIFGR